MTEKMSSTVPLDWSEVYYTNCPLVSASNVDQELGWTREEYKKIGVKYAFLRSRRENNWYPHYIHNMDNLIRFGGLFPPIHVHADLRRTKLLGATHAPHEGGCMLVRARDDIYRMTELKGKKIGLTKSLNTIKNDWWRIQEEQGIELMLRMNGMTRDDVEIVEFPYPDDWYDKPEMLDPMENPSELWLKRDHKHDLAFRPLETSLENGTVDAIYTQSKPFQHLQEDTGKFKAIEDLSRYPDWTLQVANIPAVITCTAEMAEQHPELVVAFMKGMIKVGRWANEHKRAAAAILDRQTFYRDVEDTYQGIKHIDMVPNFSPKNLASIEIGKDFMLSHGYIKNDFDVHEWAAPEFLEEAAKQLLEEEWAQAHPEEGRHHRDPRHRARPDRLKPIPTSDGPAGRDTLPAGRHRPTPPTYIRTKEEGDHDDHVRDGDADGGQGPRSACVTPAEAAAQVAAGEAVLLDVREGEEWQHGHIDGSVPAPRGPAGVLGRPDQPPPQGGSRPDPPRHRRVRLRHPRHVRGRDPEDAGLRGRRRPRGRPQGVDGRRTAHQRARVHRHLTPNRPDKGRATGRHPSPVFGCFP